MRTGVRIGAGNDVGWDGAGRSGSRGEKGRVGRGELRGWDSLGLGHSPPSCLLSHGGAQWDAVGENGWAQGRASEVRQGGAWWGGAECDGMGYDMG